METLRSRGLQKTPTGSRRFPGCAAALAMVFCARLALAQDATSAPLRPLEEADIIRIARSRSPAAQVAVATMEIADARVRTAALLPNPAFRWARETVQSGPAAGKGSQDIVTASIPIDIARPLAMRSLVASESAWMRTEASLARSDGVLDALLAYYDVVIDGRRVEVFSQAQSNLEEAARVLARREEAGIASGYESTRLAVARELSRSHLAEARGTLEAARVRLAACLGATADSLRVATALELLSAGEEIAFTTGGGEPREALRQAQNSLQLAGEAEARAEWAWLPTLELGGGLKRADNFDASHGFGYALDVSLQIPIVDHGQTQRQLAAAQRSLAAARTQMLTRSIAGEVQRALTTFRTAREELSRFEAETLGPLNALLAAAQSGYLEGERTIVELLDAQRAQIEVVERRLHLLGTAKRAEARLRAAAGDFQ